jgi:hypothetical protein
MVRLLEEGDVPDDGNRDAELNRAPGVLIFVQSNVGI